MASLPSLGVGLGFREPFRSDLFACSDRVDFLEITVDHYLDASRGKGQELELLADHFTLIPHGLNLSLGSADGLDPTYTAKFEGLVKRLNPPWWSEHIAFTRAGGVEIGHLSPLPFTFEAVDVLCKNITEAQDRIGIPLILENITYTVELPGAEMSEGEFLTEVLDRTGCGLLLDVTNLHTNAINHGLDLSALLNELPWDRVVQLHFTGGHDQNGILIDSHSQPTPAAVWVLMEMVVERAKVKGIILERDENIPPFGELLEEVARARAIGQKHGRWN